MSYYTSYNENDIDIQHLSIAIPILLGWLYEASWKMCNLNQLYVGNQFLTHPFSRGKYNKFVHKVIFSFYNEALTFPICFRNERPRLNIKVYCKTR